MTEPPEALHDPLPLAENRVGRFYRGGALLDEFRGASRGADSNQPEDWVGSVTRSWAPPGAPAATEGLSRVTLDGVERRLAEVLADHPDAVAGELGRALGTTGVLVKLLDAAQRLPVHCHPTRELARRALASPFGKAEAWIIVATRQIPGDEPPNIRLGFARDVGAAELRDWIDRADSRALLGAMRMRAVSPGEVFFVPPGLPHAIGPGVFMIEVQEPTDFSIVAETAGFPMDPRDAHLRRGWDEMTEAFDRGGLDEAALDALTLTADIGHVDGSLRETRLLGAESAPFFRASRLTVSSEAALPYAPCYAVLVVTGGSGHVWGRRASVSVRRGDTLAVPAAALPEVRLVAGEEQLEIVACLPPVEPVSPIGDDETSRD